MSRITRRFRSTGSLPLARVVAALSLTLGALEVSPLAAQAPSRAWITETSVTWGRGGFAHQGVGTDAVVIADLGQRWTYPSGAGWGLSAASGYDMANEAFLVGGRGRVGRTWGRYRGEASLAVLFSSLDDGDVGGVLGLAFYPASWGALLLQVDVMPTEPQLGCRAGDVSCTRGSVLSGGSDLAVSYGVRLSERPALFSWAAAGMLGLAAAAFGGELGCC